MSLTSGFFNSLNHDRKYDSSDISRIFDGIIEDGVYGSVGSSLVVLADIGRTVKVGTGRAWFNHTWTYNDTILPVTADYANILLDRIDALVLEVNTDDDVRKNSIKFINGVAASEPTRPTLLHTETINQYPLCYVYRSAGIDEITQADITNMIGSDECPIVTSPLQTIDINALIPQWQDSLDQFMENQEDGFIAWFDTIKQHSIENEADFDAWFDAIKGQLSTDAAGNLQNQINAIHDSVDTQLSELNDEIDATIANLRNNDQEARNDIVDIKMRLKEQLAITFINKTGLGFFDTFDTTNYVDVQNTSANIDTSKTNVEFGTYQNYVVAKTTVTDSNQIQVDRTVYTDDIIKGSKVLSLSGSETTITKDLVSSNVLVKTPVTGGNNKHHKNPRLLSNGWVLMANQNGNTVTFSVTKNGGTTVEDLCVLTTTSTLNQFSFTTYGTKVYVAICLGGTEVWIYTFDAVSPPTNVITSNPVRVDYSQTSFGDGIHIIRHSSGKLYIIWSSINTLYPNYTNLRCSYSSDDGLTWLFPVQMTESATGSNPSNNTNCNMFETNDGNIVLSWAWAYSPDNTYRIRTRIMNQSLVFIGANVDAFTIVMSAANQVNPFMIQLKHGPYSGRLMLCWTGRDATYTNNHMKWCYSTNNGASWSASERIMQDSGIARQDCQLFQDKNGKVFFVTGTTSPTQVLYVTTDNFITYSAISTAATASYATYEPQICQEIEDITSVPFMTYWEQTSTSVKITGSFTVVITNKTVNLETPISTTAGEVLSLSRVQRLSMSPEEFDQYKRIYLSVYSDVNTLTVKNTASNTDVIDVLKSSRIPKVGDKIFTTNSQKAVIDGVIGNSSLVDNLLTMFETPYGMSTQAPIQILTNGWMIAILQEKASPYKIVVYVSKDNGVSWSKLTEWSVTSTTLGIYAACSKGTKVYIAAKTTTNAITFTKFDATSVGATLSSISTTVAGVTTEPPSIDISNNGVLMFAGQYSSTTSYFAKSLDDGVSWMGFGNTPGSYNQWTDSSNYYNSIRIVATSDTTACAIQVRQIASAPNYYADVYYITINASGVVSRNYIYNSSNGGYIAVPTTSIYSTLYRKQNAPNSNRLFCVYSIKKGANNLSLVMKYSDDGGTTWSAEFLVTDCGTAYTVLQPTITENSNGDIFVVYPRNTAAIPGRYNLWCNKFTGSSFAGEVAMTARTDDSVTYPVSIDGVLDFLTPPVMYDDTYRTLYQGKIYQNTDYTLNLSIPVTVNSGDKIYAQDYTVKNNGVELPLIEMYSDRSVYGTDNLTETIVDLDILSSEKSYIESIAYAIS